MALYHPPTHTSPRCFAWAWPQFVNILPLAHPLCWYNDHLTVKSKARRKLGRRQQRGQQHWSNYVSFSPSILTLMKSLIVRGREGGEGRTGAQNVRCSFILFSEMNGRSGRNNVEIKSGQQVCRFFPFPSSSYRRPCILQWQRKKRQKGRAVWEADDLERTTGGMKGRCGVSHVSIFLKDKSKKLPTLTFEVFTFLQNVCPFPL